MCPKGFWKKMLATTLTFDPSHDCCTLHVVLIRGTTMPNFIKNKSDYKQQSYVPEEILKKCITSDPDLWPKITNCVRNTPSWYDKQHYDILPRHNCISTLPKYDSIVTFYLKMTAMTLPRHDRISTLPRYDCIVTLPRQTSIMTLPRHDSIVTLPGAWLYCNIY